MLDFVKGILSDKGHVRRNTFIQIVIATIAFILLMRVYPFSIVESHKTSRQQAKSFSSESFGYADKKLQGVMFANEHIYQIRLYVKVSMPDYVSSTQYVTFRLYDENFSCISSENVSLFKAAKKGYILATPDMDVTTGQMYYYEILVPETCQANIELLLGDTESLAQTENTVLFIDGIYNDTQSLAADYIYSSPLSAFGVICRYIVIIALAMLLYIVVIYCLDIYDVKFSDYGQKLVKVVKVLASVIIALFGIVVLVYSVVLNKFGSSIADRTVYVMAVVAAEFYGLAAIWISGHYPKAKRDYSRPLIWKNYIQTVSFGLLFYALCQYVNAQIEITHQVNTRWMLIFLALAFLMLLNGKVIINKFSGVWLVIGWICSAVYCHGYRADSEAFLLARLTCGVIVAWGLFLLNLAISFGKQGVKYKISLSSVKFYIWRNRFQTVFFALWLLFTICMYIYRFEKVWVFTATLPFAMLLFIKLTPQIKSRLLKNFTNGIILSFMLVSLYAFIHRPFNYWIAYRYGGMFHTVACTGMYLALVFGAVLGKMYGRMRDRKNVFVRCYYEFLLIGIVTGYIILTMSRTAFLAVMACLVMLSALTAFVYKKGIMRILQELGILAATVVVCFPLVFTATRMIPAIVNDPVVYDVEYRDDEWMINLGDPIYSDNYMTINRLFNLLFNRISVAREDGGGTSEVLLAYNGNSLADMGIQQYTENGNTYELSNDSDDTSNGRVDTFLAYIKNFTLAGHSGMGPVNEETGEEYAHAHNSYLQVFYNFGIIGGVLFLALCALTLYKSADLAAKLGRKYSIFYVPFALIVVFGAVSLTEWAFHPCIPIGLCYLLMQMVLIKD